MTEDEQTKNAFTRIEDVSPQNVPLIAGPRDVVEGFDELNGTIYRSESTGELYTLYPETKTKQEPPLLTAAKAVGDYISDPSLPSLEETSEFAKEAVKGAYEPFRKIASGDSPTYGDLTEVLPAGMSGAATRIGKPLDTSVVSSGGAGPAASKKTVPFFKKKGAATNMPDAAFGIKKVSDIFDEDQWDMLKEDPESPWSLVPDGETWDLPDGYDAEKLGYARNVTIDDLAKIRLGKVDVENLLDDQYGTDPTPEAVEYINSRLNQLSNNTDFVGYLNKRGENPDFDPYAAMEGQESSDKIVFKSPIPEALSSMGWPNKGKEGYQILSELRNNSSIRKSELDTVVSDIDPKKRYTLEEAQELVSGNLWNTEVRVRSGDRGETSFETYQRQIDLQDPEKEYFELIIDSRREGDKPTFEAKGQHFEPSTLAHARASVRVDDRGEYILPEEFQADLLQKGYSEPRSKSAQTSPAAVIERKKDKLTSYDEDELDLLKILGEDRHSTFFDYNSYKDFLEKVGPENLAPGKTQEEILEMLGPTSRTFSSDDLLGLYANFKVGKDIGSVTPNSPEAWDYWDNLKDTYFNVVDTDVSITEDPGVSAPPIKKIEESVKMTLGALIAEADKRGIDRIVIPPFERIVARRFTPGTEDYKKALDPKSGFYKTYVKSTQAAIKDLEEEFGRENISSRPVDLNYKTTSLSDVEEALTRKLGYSPDDGWEGYLNSEGFHQDLRTYFNAGDSDKLPSSGLQPQEFREILRNLRIKGLKNADIEDFGYGEFRPLSEVMREKLGEDLVVTGTEIDFKGLRGSGYDLRRLRFAEGGMVEEDQMNRLMQEGGMTDDGMTREPVTGNEIPPGSMASEVRDDIPAQLSEGEYIVPADVVRFFGVRFFEDLRSQAKQGLAEMDADGRIGGTPVDAQGVPVEGQDEELSPEEQQMLMEALGASGGAGMAYGGMITQTPANPYPLPDMSVPVGMAEGGMPDRTQFSLGTGQTGIQQRKYINPTTKEERTINFLNDTPLGIVPEGFVPWTQELADAVKAPETETPTNTATEKVEREGRDRDQQGTGTSEKSYEGWAKENYDAITSDPYGFGVNAINDASKQATGFGRVFSGGIIGDIQKMEAISDAQAALSRVTDEAQKQDLQSRIDALTGSISSPIVGLLTDIGFTATGKQKNAAINAITNPTTATRNYQSDFSIEKTREAVAKGTFDKAGYEKAWSRPSTNVEGRTQEERDRTAKEREKDLAATAKEYEKASRGDAGAIGPDYDPYSDRSIWNTGGLVPKKQATQKTAARKSRKGLAS